MYSTGLIGDAIRPLSAFGAPYILLYRWYNKHGFLEIRETRTLKSLKNDALPRL